MTPSLPFHSLSAILIHIIRVDLFSSATQAIPGFPLLLLGCSLRGEIKVQSISSLPLFLLSPGLGFSMFFQKTRFANFGRRRGGKVVIFLLNRWRTRSAAKDVETSLSFLFDEVSSFKGFDSPDRLTVSTLSCSLACSSA